MIYIDLEIGSQEWLDYRKKGIGASESSSILSMNPWSDSLDLWEQKVLDKKVFLNSKMKRGQDREEEARVWFEKKMGVVIMPKMIQHPNHSWKYATLDGIDLDEQIIVEIKWANDKVHSQAKAGIVADYYYPQVQSQIACSGLDSAFFLSCQDNDGIVDFQVVEVDRDQSFINWMIEKEEFFYKEHLLPKVAPMGRVKKTKIQVSENPVFDEMCRKRAEILLTIKQLQKEADMFQDGILDLALQSQYATKSFELCKIAKKGAIEYKDIPELKGVDLEPYRKSDVEYIRITEVKNSEEGAKAPSE